MNPWRTQEEGRLVYDQNFYESSQYKNLWNCNAFAISGWFHSAVVLVFLNLNPNFGILF